jgi:tetratricopeptide (TPR) repeat protein
LRAALDRSPDDSLLQKQLAAVLIELGEEADFLRRSGVNVLVDHTCIEQAAAWLAGQDTLQEQRDLARAHLLVGRIDEAIAGLEAYSLASGELASTDLNAQRALGVAYRLTEALDASREVLTTALRIALNDVRTAVELAQTYLAARQPKTALTLLERLVDQFPENPTLLYHCAMAGHAAEETGGATDLLRRAVECDSSVGKWQQTLAEWLREQGEADAALPYAEVGVELQPESQIAEAKAELALVLADLERPEEAIPLWHAALELEPDNSGWWGILGKLLLAAGRPHAAADCYARAVDLESTALGTSRAPATGDNHEHHLGWARALLTMGELDEAGCHVKLALDEQPNLAASHAGLGEWQAATGNWQEALTSFRKAAVLSGNGASAPPAERASYLLQVAQAHRALGSLEPALQNLDHAAQMAPDLGIVFALMGAIHEELGNRDPARQAYQQAARVAPSDPGYVLKLARFLQEEGQLDQALDWLMKTIAVAPTAALWIQAASVYEQRNQRGKRLEALHRAAAREPENARVHYELGLAYKQRKEYQMAIEAFEKAISLDPGDQAAHKQLSAVVAISITNEMGRG